MRRFSQAVVLPLVLLVGTVAHAQESVELGSMLQLATRQSPTLANARVDLEVARAQVVSSTGLYDFFLSAGGSYTITQDRAVSGNVIGTNGSTQALADMSISRLLPTGGTVSLSAQGSRRNATLSFNNMEVTTYNTQITADISQPLLRGRGEQQTEARVRQARHNLSAAELEVRVNARNEVQKLLEAYWELVWSHSDLEIRKSALILAEERKRLTSTSIEVGSAPRTALLEVEQVLATNEEEILLAEQRLTQRSLELRRLAGMEIAPGHLNLVPSESLNVSAKTFSLDEVVAQAFAASPEIAALEERGKSATIEVEVSENGTLSRLDLTFRAGPVGTSDSVANSLERAATLKGYVVGAGLRFEQNLGTTTAEGRSEEARAQRRRVKINIRDLKMQIASTAAQAVQSADIAKKRMELSRKAMDLSEQNIEAERKRFELGRSTNFDVLQRQEELKQARLRYARAAVDYLRSVIAIQALTGRLLEEYGVSLGEPS